MDGEVSGFVSDGIFLLGLVEIMNLDIEEDYSLIIIN